MIEKEGERARQLLAISYICNELRLLTDAFVVEAVPARLQN